MGMNDFGFNFRQNYDVSNQSPVMLMYVSRGHISHLKQHLWIPVSFFAYPIGHSGEHIATGTCTRQKGDQ